MKGIILAGGSGTRLYPVTLATSKQLIDICEKPMIYYPLSTLMLAGIKDILLITTEKDQPRFMDALGDGSSFGINLSYKIQPSPDGLAQAFTIGKEFIGEDECAMALGDNIYYGNNFKQMLLNARKEAENGKASIFGYKVHDPERFGIMEIDENQNVLSVEEKPSIPKSNFAITGLYFYPKGVSEKAEKVEKSARGEYEITSLNDMYLKEGNLRAELLGGGFTWFDTGTFDSLDETRDLIKVVEKNQGRKVCCPEEIAYNNGWIDSETLLDRAKFMGKSNYGKYLIEMAERAQKVLAATMIPDDKKVKSLKLK